MDGVKLSFDQEALEAVAELALERNTGARGLRSIMENAMTEIMYEIPSRHDVAEVVITPTCIKGEGKSEYVLMRELPTEEEPAALPEANN
jgi:ATP-dependent Clp protease ATP-binding subunit ClpX